MMDFRRDAETIGAVLAEAAPVFYATFDETRAQGITESEAFYVAMTDVAIEYPNDSPEYAEVTETFTISAFVRSVAEDAEVRCLILAATAVNSINEISIGPNNGPVLVDTIKREALETQSTCLYTLTVTAKFTEVL